MSGASLSWAVELTARTSYWANQRCLRLARSKRDARPKSPSMLSKKSSAAKTNSFLRSSLQKTSKSCKESELWIELRAVTERALMSMRQRSLLTWWRVAGSASLTKNLWRGTSQLRTTPPEFSLRWPKDGDRSVHVAMLSTKLSLFRKSLIDAWASFSVARVQSSPKIRSLTKLQCWTWLTSWQSSTRILL